MYVRGGKEVYKWIWWSVQRKGYYCEFCWFSGAIEQKYKNDSKRQTGASHQITIYTFMCECVCVTYTHVVHIAAQGQEFYSALDNVLGSWSKSASKYTKKCQSLGTHASLSAGMGINSLCTSVCVLAVPLFGNWHAIQ